MNAAKLLWVLFFLKMSLVATYGMLWLWAKRSARKIPKKLGKKEIANIQALGSFNF